jgi:DNA topoisomerase II
MKTSYVKNYQTVSDREHVLLRPGMYIGSIDNVKEKLYIYDDKTNKIIEKEILYNAGLYKIFDEIIDNAADASDKDKTCNIIKVNIDNDIITVYNNGVGIDCELYQNTDKYIPEILFGQLRSSSNYNDAEERNISGMNGIGAKGTNIYSEFFNVEIVCKNKFYKQSFTKNMSIISKPEIKNVENQKSYVKITFKPDYKRFGLETLSYNMKSLFKKRVIDLAFYLLKKKVKVCYNDNLININSFKDYINYYFDNLDEKNMATYENNKWNVSLIYTRNSGFKYISIVNGLTVNKGGSHINYVLNQIINGNNGLINKISAKHKDVNIRPAYIKDNITLFVSCIIDKPQFNSQSKEELTNNITARNGCIISNEFIDKIMNSELIDDVINLAIFKDEQNLKKTDGKRGKKEIIEKYRPAAWAGTKRSQECLLIITEGDSAKTFALWGIKEYEEQTGHGNDKFGVFPIRGKMLNVRNANIKQIQNNAEITNIKKIIGLRQDMIYNNQTAKELNYGGILILTDQDLDGFHIAGLIINFIHTFWRELILVDGFFKTLQTPILKAFKKNSKLEKPITFYYQTAYEQWLKTVNKDNYTIKYYKGLGTSTDKEAMECFEDFDEKVLCYKWETQTLEPSNENIFKINNILNTDVKLSPTSSDKTSSSNIETPIKKTKKTKPTTTIKRIVENPTISDDALTLAFAKDRVEDRKKWLEGYNENVIYEPGNDKMIPYSDFINKNFIHFSNYDNIRSIPSICDGLKPSQRKILYTVLKKNIKKANNIKVSQLANKVSEITCYLHGEQSLCGAIVNMAQQFVGVNNINLLYPLGNFGTRNQGGKDVAASRYIYTYANTLLEKIFRPEDNVILKQREEENTLIEPYTYFSIIPMSLVNGALGIGTGYSTDIPMFNPNEIIDNIINILTKGTYTNMIPWYKDFEGEIVKIQGKNYMSIGKCELNNKDHNGKIHITELPIGVWTEDYTDNIKRKIIESKKDNKECIFVDIDNYSSPDNVNIKLRVKPEFIMDCYENIENNDIVDGNKPLILMKKLGLTQNIGLTNMYLHDENGKIHKYNNVKDILVSFINFRLKKYRERKNIYILILENELRNLEWKIKFINDYISKTIIIERKKKDEIINNLIKLNYPKLSSNYKATEEEKSYDYITDMKIFDLTEEKINDLENRKNNKLKELEEYKKITTKQLWIKELIELKDAYNKIEANEKLEKEKKKEKSRQMQEKRLNREKSTKTKIKNYKN